jgi:hypothetical protein
MPGQNSAATSTTPNHSPRKLSPVAQRAFDAAMSWTQEAEQDASNLLPLERDFFLIGLAAEWNDVDHPRAEAYLTPALQDIKTELKENKSQIRLASFMTMFSGDVIKVDREAWNSLMAEIPPSYARQAISDQADEMAVDDNVAGAVELEKKALSLGGSERDYVTVEHLIETDPVSAAQLFEEVLATAVRHESNPMLLPNLIRRAFEEHKGDDEIRSFYDAGRKQKIVSACAQKISSDDDAPGCYCAWDFEHLQPKPQLPDSELLRSALAKCSRFRSGSEDQKSESLASTDDIVRAMNETSDANRKFQLRQRAVDHAFEVDRDYPRAIQLCLDISDIEREYLPLWRTVGVEQAAVSYAIQGIRAALADNDVFEPERLVNLLPDRLRPEAQLQAVSLLKEKHREKAITMLNNARNTLEQEAPAQKRVYHKMLIETADLRPQDVNLAWRLLVSGLNQFDQRQRMNAKDETSKSKPEELIWEPITPWFLPQKLIGDESFVQACVGDLSSAEDRVTLRLGVIGALVARYSEARKVPSPKLANSSRINPAAQKE